MSAISSCLHGYTNMCPHCTHLTDATVGVRIPDFAGTFVFSSGPVPTQPDNALRELAKLKTEHPKIAAAADALADGLSMTDPTTTPAPSEVPEGVPATVDPLKGWAGPVMSDRHDGGETRGLWPVLAFRSKSERDDYVARQREIGREEGRREERARIARVHRGECGICLCPCCAFVEQCAREFLEGPDHDE